MAHPKHKLSKQRRGLSPHFPLAPTAEPQYCITAYAPSAATIADV